MSMLRTFERASSGQSRVPEDWMPATAVRAFVFDDPVLVWLDFYGEAHGFEKDSSPYEFTDFIQTLNRCVVIAIVRRGEPS